MSIGHELKSLPHDSRLVFRKAFLHFISVVPLVALHGLVAVLIELLSSLINCSHVFGLWRLTCINRVNQVLTHVYIQIVIMLTCSYLGTVSQLMTTRSTVETHWLGSTMNRWVMDSLYRYMPHKNKRRIKGQKLNTFLLHTFFLSFQYLCQRLGWKPVDSFTKIQEMLSCLFKSISYKFPFSEN